MAPRWATMRTLAQPSWQRFGPLLSLGVALALLATWSWRKWPDLLVDAGRQLYVPWRLSEGEALYRDLAYVMGPASQYLNALLFEIFGVSLTTLIAANLAILALIVFCTYRLLRRIVPALDATLLGTFFLCVFAFGQYLGNAGYNYLAPYRHEMTHGLAATLLALVAVLAWTDRPRARLLFAAGCCVGFTAMLKTEIFVAAAGTVAATLVAALPVVRARGARLPGAATAFFAGCLVAPLVCWALLSRQLPAGEALTAVWTNWRLTLTPSLYGANPFYLEAAGFDRPGLRLRELLVASLAWAGAIGALIAVDRLGSRLPRGRLALASIVGVAVFSSGWLVIPRQAWFAAARPLPLVAFATAAVVAGAMWRRRNDPVALRALLPLGGFSVLSGLLLLKTLLATRISFYGFVLAAPAALLLGVLLLHIVPERLRGRFGSGAILRAGSIGLLAAWAVVCLQVSDHYYRAKTLTVGTGGDRFLHDPELGARNALLPEILEALGRDLPLGATLTVLPEGGMFNYLLRRRNPTPYYLLTPWELEAFGGEASVLERMRASPPDYFLLLGIDMHEYGKRYFGDEGYGDTITRWIATDYERVRHFRMAGRPGFEAFLLRRSPGRVTGGAGRRRRTARRSSRPRRERCATPRGNRRRSSSRAARGVQPACPAAGSAACRPPRDGDSPCGCCTERRR